jgi:hypothetical protein
MNDGRDAPRSRAQIGLLATGAIGSLLFIVSFLALGGLANGYDPRRDTISSLEFTALGVGQQVNFVVFGGLMTGFAVALRRELETGRGSVLVPALQLLSACGLIGDGIFIHEPLHLVCDLVTFNATLAILFLMAWRFADEPRWKGWTAYSIVTALLMMGFLTAFGIANSHGGPAGMFEKLAVATRATWSVLLVGTLLAGRQLGRRI